MGPLVLYYPQRQADSPICAECIRRITLTKLKALGLEPVCLPLDAAATEPHLDILCSPDVSKARKVLILAPDAFGSSLGIWSLRVCTDTSLHTGSMLAIATAALENGYSIVIANPSQLFWDPNLGKALTHVSWKARERSEATAKPSATLDLEASTIPGNASPEEHLASLFDYLSTTLHPETAVDIIAVGYTARGILEYLHDNWATWEKYVHALALAESAHTLRDLRNPRFRTFLASMCRNWVVAREPLGEELDTMHHHFGMAAFSSGEEWAGNIVPACGEVIARYLNDAWLTPETCNPPVPVTVGDDIATDSGRESWMDAMRKLNLADQTQGWTVPGSEEVEKIIREEEEKEREVEDIQKVRETQETQEKDEKDEKAEDIQEVRETQEKDENKS